MKKYQVRIIAVVLLSAFALQSCSVEYRERRRAHREHRGEVHERVVIHN